MREKMSQQEKLVRGLLEQANVEIGGSRNQDIAVHDSAVYSRVIADGTLGLGESYMDGQWDANKLDVFFESVLGADLHKHVQWNRHTMQALFLAKLTNRQTKRRSKQVAVQHYDLSGVFPDTILDPYNQYTCAYFDGTEDLNTAQERKLDLICKKLRLWEGDRVLDCGCGWGGFARFAAEHYGCQVTGISISEEQIRYAKQACRDMPSVDIRLCDYRDLDGAYDKVLICGMMEHVGAKNYRTLFKGIHDHLSDDGLFLLHTIGSNTSVQTGDAFLTKYIFPNSMPPSMEQIEQAREDLFTLQDVQNLAAHYAPTLLAWNENFQRNWPTVAAQYDERFRRMFEYYLLSCAGIFQAGAAQHWQMVFSKANRVMDYRGER